MYNITTKIIESRAEWNSLLFKFDSVNLLQAWEYGEAKRGVAGWTVARMAFLKDNQFIGLAQILTKRIPLLGEIARINRGPLILYKNHQFDIDLSIQILSFLHSCWVKQKKMSLLIAPNILKEQMNWIELKKMEYKLVNNNGWASVKVDLTSDEIGLRKNLHKKWRNLLKKSERLGLELEIDNSEDGLAFLLDKYTQMQLEKNFFGPPEKLIQEIKDVTVDKSSIQVMFARKGGVRVSGILVVGYANTCHYLISWNSSEGRDWRANYFLLWQALLFFQKMGYQWFDLGGVDEKRTPNIAHFKQGLGGEAYTLIGEFSAAPGIILPQIINKILRLKNKLT